MSEPTAHAEAGNGHAPSEAVAPADVDRTALAHYGDEVHIGGRAFILPPLTFGQIRRLGPDRVNRLFSGALDLVGDEASRALLVDVAHEALARNYPDATKEWLEDALDLVSGMDLIQALMGMNSLRERTRRLQNATPA